MPDYEQIAEMVDAIQDRGVGLTVWESEFIKSCVGHYKMKNYLTTNQINMVTKIYRERTPDGKREATSKTGILSDAQQRTERFRSEGRDDFGASARRRSQVDRYGDKEDI